MKTEPTTLIDKLYAAGLVSRKFRDQTAKNIKKALAEMAEERKAKPPSP